MPTIPKLKDIKREYTKQHERSIDYYNTKGWKVLRSSYIREHPLCERCLEKGIIKAADEIHHKIPFMTGMSIDQRLSLLLDRSNLMSVCRDCHIEVHRQMHNSK